MKGFAIGALVGVAFLLGACVSSDGNILETKRLSLSSSQVASVHKGVKVSLKDPMSAQFENIKAVRVRYDSGVSRDVVCGLVNAKNGFGGYVGFQAFIGSFVEDGMFRVKGMDSDSYGFIAGHCDRVYGLPVR